jgi:hypothetical protein
MLTMLSDRYLSHLNHTTQKGFIAIFCLILYRKEKLVDI